jgi:hypothetical protein
MRIIRIVLIDVLFRVCQEIKLVTFVGHVVITWALHVTCSPVTINESPGSIDTDGSPLVAEMVPLKSTSRFVTCTFRVTFDDLTMQSRITGIYNI